MKFHPPLVRGRFLRRYKRFFVDVQLEDGSTVIAHCPNTGSLQGCLVEGAETFIQPATDPKRALRFTWKLIRIGKSLVGVDTGLAVPLVETAIRTGVLPELGGYERMLREVTYGREGSSRIDILLSRGGNVPVSTNSKSKRRTLPEGDERVYVEVKNTTLVSDGVAQFPDAVTERGQKHLEELIDVVQQGMRAAMVFCVQRTDCELFRPADHVDPVYGRLLRKAAGAGVELYVLEAAPSEVEIAVQRKIAIALD